MSIRYQGADLGNVHLESGYTIRRLPDGDEAISIKDVEGLHRAIAEALIDQPTPADGSRFRFLRKHLELTQRAAGEKLGIEEQTVSLWERGLLEVPRYADVMMRALVEETTRRSLAISEIIATLNASTQASHSESLVFAFSAELGWHLKTWARQRAPRTTSQTLTSKEGNAPALRLVDEGSGRATPRMPKYQYTANMPTRAAEARGVEECPPEATYSAGFARVERAAEAQVPGRRQPEATYANYMPANVVSIEPRLEGNSLSRSIVVEAGTA